MRVRAHAVGFDHFKVLSQPFIQPQRKRARLRVQQRVDDFVPNVDADILMPVREQHAWTAMLNVERAAFRDSWKITFDVASVLFRVGEEYHVNRLIIAGNRQKLSYFLRDVVEFTEQRFVVSEYKVAVDSKATDLFLRSPSGCRFRCVSQAQADGKCADSKCCYR